jgi:RNA polymerase sigma factor (sigma-70 family)
LKQITAEHILKGIIENDRKIIRYVYDEYFNSIKHYVLKHRGTSEDAMDLFQDGIIIIYEQVSDGNLVIKSSFFNYLYTICKYQWLKTLRNRNNIYSESIDDNPEFERLYSLEFKRELDELINKESRIKIYQKHFKDLSKECQQLLRLVVKGLKPDEIKERMNYNSVGFTYKKRRICKERLIERIKKDLDYNNTL